MTELCRFYGIVIALFSNDHGEPHIHAFYNEYMVKLTIATGRIVAGDFPAPALRLVREWVTLHRGALTAEWERARRGETIRKVPPLRSRRG